MKLLNKIGAGIEACFTIVFFTFWFIYILIYCHFNDTAQIIARYRKKAKKMGKEKEFDDKLIDWIQRR